MLWKTFDWECNERKNKFLKKIFCSTTFFVMHKLCSWCNTSDVLERERERERKKQTMLHIVVLITSSLWECWKNFKKILRHVKLNEWNLSNGRASVCVFVCVFLRVWMWHTIMLLEWNCVYSHSMGFCALTVKFTFDHTQNLMSTLPLFQHEKAFDWQNLQFTTKT